MENNVRALVMRMVLTDTMKPLSAHAGIAGEYAVEHFAEILATKMESSDGPAK